MFDFRYYLVTVCGTFIALGIGILIGISYGEDVLIYNQREVIRQLEWQLEQVNENNRELSDKVERWEEFRGYFWEDIYTDLEFSTSGVGLVVEDSSYSQNSLERLMEFLDGAGVEYWTIIINENMEVAVENLQEKLEMPEDLMDEAGVGSGKKISEIYRQLQQKNNFNSGECSQEELWLLLEQEGGITRHGNYREGEFLFKFILEEDKPLQQWAKEAGNFLERHGWETAVVAPSGVDGVNRQVFSPDKEADREDSFWTHLQVLETVRK